MAEAAAMEFVVPHQKSHLVSEKVERIRQLFSVAVAFSSPPQSAKSSGVQWIMLQGHKESNEKAKEYINSLCDPKMDFVISFPESVYNVLISLSNKLEYDSGAVITFISNRQARIQGSQMAVVMASSAIEDLKSRPGQTRAEMSHTGIDAALKEFAMKLGYTEKDIEVVVKKHGPMVNENTLLHELIKISRTPSLPSVARGPGRVPATEPERTSFAVAKGFNHITEQSRDVVARGAPSSSSTAKVHTVTVRGDRMSYERAVSPTPKRETSEKASLDKQEEQIMYQQLKEAARNGDSSSGLRHVVIDGSNVAMSHGNQEVFSCFGIALCVDWFKQRGHKDITVFVPQWRKEMAKPESPITDQEILSDLEKERIVVLTPSRRVNGRRIVCYDDRFIVRLAADTDGIIVSNDNYRDLINETPKWKEVIEQRLLMFSFVNDIFMVPDDPLGRHGPTLDDFLRKGTIAHPRICPYLRKCTFGLKCRFYHPERDPARKQEASKQADVMSSKSVAQTNYDSRRTEITTDRQTYRPEGAVYDIQGGRGGYDRQQHAVYPEYPQDLPRQRMPAVIGVRHHPYDPYYGPIHQMSPYPFQQPPRLVHEQHGGNASVGPRADTASDVTDAPWDKNKEELFQQLKAIYSNKEQEEMIRRVVQDSHGKDVLTLADIVAELVEK